MNGQSKRIRKIRNTFYKKKHMQRSARSRIKCNYKRLKYDADADETENNHEIILFDKKYAPDYNEWIFIHTDTIENIPNELKVDRFSLAWFLNACRMKSSN